MLMSLQAEEAQEQAPAWLVAADRKPSKATATATHTPNDASAEPAVKTVDLVDQLRKRRRRRNLLAVGGMILSALGLLGFASYRFVSNRLQVAQQEKKAPRDNAQPDAAIDGNSAPTASPKAPELVIAPNKKGRSSKPNSDQKLPELPSVQRDTSSPAPAVPTIPETIPEAMPEKPPTPPANPEPAPSPTPTPSPEPAASAESAAWKTAMTQAKETLAKGDLKAFEPLMAGLIDKAVSKQGKEQAARLDQAGQLYKIYVESIEESKKKAKGASSLKVGTTQVAIVESTPEKLIVREAGGNKTYAWDKLPFGIAAAISDLSLSESSPVDQAARAVYFSLSPFYQEAAKANSLVTKRIDGWFERSVGKDSVRKDLKQFLTDKYE
jgi:cytoskeletal protein RodZ